MKITLITGAASGLGREFAKLYAKDNNNLLLVDINEENLNEKDATIFSIFASFKSKKLSFIEIKFLKYSFAFSSN